MSIRIHTIKDLIRFVAGDNKTKLQTESQDIIGAINELNAKLNK